MGFEKAFLALLAVTASRAMLPILKLLVSLLVKDDRAGFFTPVNQGDMHIAEGQ